MEQICVNGRPYTVMALLGHGKGGYSYRVTDREKEYVLKQIHHEPCAYYQFGNKMEAELRDYERLKKIGIPMPELYEADIPNERILKEYIAGDTIAVLASRGEVKPDYLDQVRRMCEVLYAEGLNIDYHPTNFVVRDDRLYYIDYECNAYMEQWNFENWGIHRWMKKQNP
ncbi:MAG: hypothetical protein ACI4LH_01890 [Candidatus Heritagella sp.]